MKSISSALDAHLALECTTLTTCWEIKRADGVFFRLTEHDQDLTIDGAVYRADMGYERTAFSNSSDLSVDNVKISSFFDDAVITEDDLNRGLFDNAEVKVFVVNYADLSQGILRLRRGRLGELQSTELGIFTAELRGMAQRLQQQIGELTQAGCRAQLGAKVQCRFPIQPDVVIRNNAYAVGDFVRVPTGNLASSILAVPLLDGDFEALTNWTTVSGAPAIVSSFGNVNPFAGSNFLHGNASSSPAGYHVRQDVDITGISGFSQSDLNAGYYYFRAAIRMNKTSDNTRDAGRIRIEALDANDSVLKEVWNSQYQILKTEETWTALSAADVQLPSGTVKLRYHVEAGSYDSIGITNIGFDELVSEIVDNNAQTGAQEFYENRIYECTTAGTTGASDPSPQYDTTIDAASADGTAVFTAREAFMRHAVVASVASKRIFTLTIDTPAASADDYYNQGAVIWESGDNADRIMEVKDWDESSAQVTLFLEMPDTIQVGDKLKIFPGCNKTRAHCRDKFTIPNSTNFANGNMKNYDGEPDLPGSDHMLIYPDAK